MDTAVGLVQACLHVNGHFTVAEHPVLERAGTAVEAAPPGRAAPAEVSVEHFVRQLGSAVRESRIVTGPEERP